MRGITSVVSPPSSLDPASNTPRRSSSPIGEGAVSALILSRSAVLARILSSSAFACPSLSLVVVVPCPPSCSTDIGEVCSLPLLLEAPYPLLLSKLPLPLLPPARRLQSSRPGARRLSTGLSRILFVDLSTASSSDSLAASCGWTTSMNDVSHACSSIRVAPRLAPSSSISSTRAAR
jgi:hypothetical protein